MPSQDIIEVDAETKEMLKMMDFQSIPGLQMTTAGGAQLIVYPLLLKSFHDDKPSYTNLNETSRITKRTAS